MTGPWPVPVEIIKTLASPTGKAHIIKATLRGATLKPMGRIMVRAGHLVGQIDFVAPIDIEAQDGLVVMLCVAPEEMLAGEVAHG